jgi:WD40 repeat protein
VSLQNGSVEDLLPDPALALALSPDDSQLAYFYGSSERGLVVRDLATGEERETKIDPGKDFDVGKILWSPDRESLALTLAINPCTGDYGLSKTVWAESTTILWIHAKTLQQKVLVDEDPRWFVTLEWNEASKIVITDGEENSLWHLDVNSGEITRP